MTPRFTKPVFNPARYAIYYAPPQGSELAQFGMHWLCRDAETGEELLPMTLPDYSVSELRAITERPGRYCFHGTLKPPFRLHEDKTEDELLGFAEKFAATLQPVCLSKLQLKWIGSFAALVPQSQNEVANLAEVCLRAFEPFRADPTIAEIERYRVRGLTQRQTQYLAQWGYPYVLKEYKFHLTLTDSIPEKKERKRLCSVFKSLTAGLCKTKFTVNELCLFKQENKNSPFRIIQRFKLGE